TGWGVVDDGLLFGPGGQPELHHIDQGSIRDCWWLAGMGALAGTDEGRSIIKRMIRRNPNGTYTVTFPDTSRTTVTPYFPIKANGTIAYARPTGRPPAIWPLVLEKALADMRGSYGALVQGDGGDAMRILTGTPGESRNPAVVGRDQLERWLDEGGVTILTPNEGNGTIYEGDGARLNTDHVYVVQHLTDDGEIKLYNPWGRDHATITMDEFHRHFEDVDFNPIR
ncbi:C2 family cysteine protease, partial [Actinomadura adrarensis]